MLGNMPLTTNDLSVFVRKSGEDYVYIPTMSLLKLVVNPDQVLAVGTFSQPAVPGWFTDWDDCDVLVTWRSCGPPSISNKKFAELLHCKLGVVYIDGALPQENKVVINTTDVRSREFSVCDSDGKAWLLPRWGERTTVTLNLNGSQVRLG